MCYHSDVITAALLGTLNVYCPECLFAGRAMFKYRLDTETEGST